MILLSTFFIIVGSFCFYNTSNKAILNSSAVEKHLQNNPIKTKILGGALYIFSFIIALQRFDAIIAITYWILFVGVVLCFLIIFMPLRNQKK